MGEGPRVAIERLAASLVSSPALSRVTGHLADLRLPSFAIRPLLRLYVRGFGVDLGEAAEPLESFPTFNAFFTRRLREGARPIAGGEGVVVSPSDSRLSVIGPVPPDGRLEQVKGSNYSIDALLGSPEDAAPFRRGAHATLYLSPAMYHRVHSPVDGRVVAWRYVPGRLFPVNGAGVRSVPGLFTRNERVAVFLDTPAHGPVAVVLVGAANVGRISLAFADLVTNRGRPGGRTVPAEPVAVRRGDEIGAFNLGSTVVLLLADPGLAPTAGAGDLVRVGQALWRRS
ncbi:MAG TPA: archaetidylserine decarboxylase [Vicinamibacteria bacterium]|nr:archaetidylserine decarboxylase [Vicinamibacteria bacterium]